MNPTSTTSCGSGLESAEACAGSGTPDRFKYYVTPTTANGDKNAHYILGNHYQWNAATAGTGGTITSGNASGSICPKGWRLPTGNGGEFAALVTALGGSSSANNAIWAPFYGVRAGLVSNNTDSFINAGIIGHYWSSTSATSSSADTYLFIIFSDTLSVTNRYNRQTGRSIRCVAQ